MCGLVGAFAASDMDPEQLREPIKRLTRLVARRGPDDEGQWNDGRRCAFGFRRLAILDLAPTGHQPMTTTDGRFTIVFNGELYNFREIRTELEQRGRTFRSTGDAEVALVAIAEWGTDALARFNGMFALACYDATEQNLLLARDHAGIKPMWYARTARGVVFASQYNQIIQHPWCRAAEIDHSHLGLYLRLGFVPAPFGLHAGTGQLEAGQWLRIARDGRVTTGYHFTLPQRGSSTLRGGDALDAFERAFANAVKRQMISDVPIGVFLSGGIDSPLVAAEARNAATGTLRAFSIGVEDPTMDESADASRYASELGVEPIVQTFTAADALAMIDAATEACTEPTADYSIFPTLMVSRLARQHVTVALSGDGGDELYWGYPSRFGSAIEQARYFGWPKPARVAAVGARKYLRRGAATRDVVDYPNVGRLYLRKHTLTAERDLAGIFPSLPAVPSSFTAFHFTGTDVDSTAAWVRWNEFTVHLARVLQKVDRASMFNSLEVRVPLLDREVIDVAWQTDWRSCLDVKHRLGKQILRQALARRVSKITVAKKGFTVPMHEWLVGPLRGVLEEHVLAKRDLLGLPIDNAALRRVDTQLRSGDRSKAWGMWLLLALALWSKTHVVTA